MSNWPDGGPPPSAASTIDIQIDRENTTTIVHLAGELDLAAANQLTTAIHDLLSDGAVRKLVFDLAGVGFCDSAGIAILIKAWHTGQAIGVPVYARAAQPRVAAVLQITGVWSVLCTGPLPDTAQQHLPHPAEKTLTPADPSTGHDSTPPA